MCILLNFGFTTKIAKYTKVSDGQSSELRVLRGKKSFFRFCLKTISLIILTALWLPSFTAAAQSKPLIKVVAGYGSTAEYHEHTNPMRRDVGFVHSLPDMVEVARRLVEHAPSILQFFDQQEFPVALDDLSFDFADSFVQQNFVRQFAIDDLLPDFRNALRAQRVGGSGPTQGRLGLLIGLQ